MGNRRQHPDLYFNGIAHLCGCNCERGDGQYGALFRRFEDTDLKRHDSNRIGICPRRDQRDPDAAGPLGPCSLARAFAHRNRDNSRLLALSGYVKATAGVVSAGAIADADLPATIKGSTIEKDSNVALAADGVLVTTIAAGIVGIVMVKETTALNQYFLLTPTTVGGALMTNAAYTATKDGAATINVYIDAGVVKVQNKTSSAINIKVGFVGFN